MGLFDVFKNKQDRKPEQAPVEQTESVEEIAPDLNASYSTPEPTDSDPVVEDAPVADAPVEETPVEQAPVEQAPAPVEEAPAEPAAQDRTYTVEPGDNLSMIGEQFGVDYMEIARVNGLDNPDLIFPGQVLRIP